MRSQSAQFAAIGLQPKKRTKRPATAVVEVRTAPAPKRAKAVTGAQIPRGFVTPLAADSKYFDTASAQYAFNNGGGAALVKHLDIIPQGDTVNQRQGKSWQNTNLQVRGYIYNDTGAAVNHIAMYIVWDRQPNKVLATVADLLESSTASDAFMKRENKGRFLVIKKWHRVLLGNTTALSTGREAIVIDKWIRLPQECIAQATAADTTGAIGNRVTGALLAFFVGSNAAGNADASSVLSFRVGFKDTP